MHKSKKDPRLSWEYNYLARSDVKILLRTFREQIGRKYAFRDQFLLIMIYRHCLRLHEASTLNVGHLVTDEYLDVRRELEILGKGRKYRTLPIKQETQKLAKQFLKYKKKMDESLELDAPLFVSRHGQRMCDRQIERIVDKWIKLAGVKRITAHGLRVSSITHIAHSGPTGPVAANRAAGHASMGTTSKYLRLSPDEYSAAMEGLV